MKNEQVLAYMRGRANQCRRLAQGTIDERTSRTLMGMAREIEEDMKRLAEEAFND